ncbi:MAG: hypothetical protein COA71_02165 [SAR86 cluster bacterium]|uniref:Uncharacterized protein n=1 Tax=SAR86 cluster bacterium TaxID=2030880 RepID=A0A2A5CIJ7_9GAMM|nr:MAG: hypothetical protein COA71_02165 [SAR86 cluster bacterium]
MYIKVRSYIRVLGILLSILGIFVTYQIAMFEENLDYSDYFWIFFNTFIFLPLIFTSSILGRVPYFISERIPKIFEETILHAENNFTEFSFESVVGAIIALTIMFLTTYFQS